MALHVDTVKLRHMLDAAQKAVLFAQNKKRQDLVFDGIRELMTPSEPNKQSFIGFAPREKQKRKPRSRRR